MVVTDSSENGVLARSRGRGSATMPVLHWPGAKMLRKYQTPTGSFTRKSTFFWASVGATVGLANLWQFPYIVSTHGGGLFILIYLACLLLVTLPLMVAEAALGRHARHGIVLTMAGMVKNAGCPPFWRAAGPLSVLAAFLVLSFTVVFGGIVLAYTFFGAFGRFDGLSMVSAASLLTDFVSDPNHYRPFMAWHALFLLLALAVSAQGVAAGLERAVRIIVPATLVLLLLLFALFVRFGSLDTGISKLLVMRPEQVSLASVKAALFHAFYTLGFGMGVWAVFGAYSTGHTRLKRSVLAVVLVDTLVAIIAGLMLFSVVNGSIMDGERGFSLLFVSLPVALAGVPFSQVFIALAFLLIVMIVWATTMSLLEPVVGWFREWTGAPRGWSVVIVGSAVWLAGLASLFSFNLWANYRPGGATLFRWLELVAGGILVPAVAVLLATFFGWCLTRRYATLILGAAPYFFTKLWFWVMRLVLPVVAAWVGMQYTFVSLANLCDNASSAFWCVPEEQAVPQSQPETPDAPAAGPARVTPAQVELDEDQEPASESAPKQPDILYHSV